MNFGLIIFWGRLIELSALYHLAITLVHVEGDQDKTYYPSSKSLHLDVRLVVHHLFS